MLVTVAGLPIRGVANTEIPSRNVQGVERWGMRSNESKNGGMQLPEWY